MHTLHLTAYDPNRYWECIRGIRQALFHLGDDEMGNAHLADARRILDAFREAEGAPQFIGENENVEQAQLQSNGGDGLIDLDPSAVEQPQDAGNSGESEDEFFSDQEYRTAMALLAMSDGEPSKAMAYCGTLARATDEGEFFQGVAGALLSVFPWRDELPPVVIVGGQ
jgi:hypothetical protein